MELQDNFKKSDITYEHTWQEPCRMCVNCRKKMSEEPVSNTCFECLWFWLEPSDETVERLGGLATK